MSRSASATITIRHATIADFAAVTRLRNQLIAESRVRRPDFFRPVVLGVTEALFQALLAEPDVAIHVAEAGGVVAGCAVVWTGTQGGHDWAFPQRVAFIRELVVATADHKRGIGRALIAAVEAKARGEGVEEIALYVDQTNTTAQAFYERVGLTSQSQYRHKLIRHVRRMEQD